MEGNGPILERCYVDIYLDRLSRTTKQSSQIQCRGSDLNRVHSGQFEPEGYVKVSKYLKWKCISSQCFPYIRNGIYLLKVPRLSPLVLPIEVILE